jgi:hypothetical protein
MRRDPPSFNWRMYLDRAVYQEDTQCLIYHSRVARRFYEMYYGVTPAGFVCHTCDNPACINPTHLWIGSHRENQLDALKKGRHTSQQGLMIDYMKLHPEKLVPVKFTDEVRTKMRIAAAKRWGRK